MELPYFDFYPGNWMEDGNNKKLSWAEKGVHLQLLCLMWDEPDCMLADRDSMIARMLGETVARWRKWKAVLIDGPYPVIRRFDGRLYSPKLWDVRITAIDNKIRSIKATAERWGWTPEVHEHVANLLQHRADIYSALSQLHPKYRAKHRPKHHAENHAKQPTQHVPTNNNNNSNSRKRSSPPSGGRIIHAPPGPDSGPSGREDPAYSPEFEAFWAVYPRKIEKGAAWKAWQARIREGWSGEVLCQCAEHYAESCANKDRNFVKYPKSFLGPARPFVDYRDGPLIEAPSEPAPAEHHKASGGGWWDETQEAIAASLEGGGNHHDPE